MLEEHHWLGKTPRAAAAATCQLSQSKVKGRGRSPASPVGVLNRRHPPPHLLHPLLRRLRLARQQLIPHDLIAQALKHLEKLLHEQRTAAMSLEDRSLRRALGQIGVQFLLACFAAAASILACLAGGASAVAIVQGLVHLQLFCSREK